MLHVGEMQPLLQPVIMSVLQGMQGEHAARPLQPGAAVAAVGAVGAPSWQGQDVAASLDARPREDTLGAREVTGAPVYIYIYIYTYIHTYIHTCI